jgi:hypothetical protein
MRSQQVPDLAVVVVTGQGCVQVVRPAVLVEVVLLYPSLGKK